MNHKSSTRLQQNISKWGLNNKDEHNKNVNLPPLKDISKNIFKLNIQMKKMLNILLVLMITSTFAQTQAYKGLNFGMDKNQVKKEFKANKKAYQNIIFAGNEFKIYKEAFVYDNNGKLAQIFFNLKKGGMYGIDYSDALVIYEVLNTMFLNDGHILDIENTKTGNSIKNNLITTYQDKDKNTTIYLGLSRLSSTGQTKAKGRIGYLYVIFSQNK